MLFFDASSVGLFVTSFFTIFVTIFIAELTDKDALLLLALATKTKAWIAFASGASAFTITTTIIVSVGYVLVQLVPVWIIKVAGGAIMIGYALIEYLREGYEEKKSVQEGDKLVKAAAKRKRTLSIFLGAVLMLCVLDLAGDATEVLTIVYVAHFQNVFLVFLGCVASLVAASAVETALGNRLGKVVSLERLRFFSLAVFVLIGAIILVTTFYPLNLPLIT